MTPEKRAELTAQLADHGLSVLLTRDLDGILLELARLAQFERLVMTNDHIFNAGDIAAIRASCALDPSDRCRPMEVIDVPVILDQVNKALHVELDKQTSINPLRVNAAVIAFTGIIRVEAR